MATPSAQLLINYPSRGFIAEFQRAIKENKSIQIQVVWGWRQRILKRLMPILVEDNGIVQDHFGSSRHSVARSHSTKYVMSMFVLPGFFYVHFYALSQRYRFDGRVGDRVLYIEYQAQPSRVGTLSVPTRNE